MEKLHYLGLLFLNFAVLNILLSLFFFLIALAGKRFLSSPLLKSRLFFASLVAPPALSAFTILSSFAPPMFIKIPGKSMFCLNEPYCYIFSFVPTEVPLFDWFLIAAVGIVLIPLVYSAIGIRNYFRLRNTLIPPFFASLNGSACIERSEKSDAPPLEKGGMNTPLMNELKAFEGTTHIRVRVIDLPYMVSLLWGYRSNILIISTEVLKRLTIDELRCLLAHEISHYKRRDNILKGILLLCRSSLFIFPHVYYLFRWWREEIEVIGDERAATTTGRPLDVASALLKMMAAPSGDLGPYATGFNMTRNDHIFTRRVERLVAIHDCKIRPENRGWSFIPSETGLLLGMTSLFLMSFMAIYELSPLLLHCYLERLLSLG